MKNRYQIIDHNTPDSRLYQYQWQGYYWYSKEKGPELVNGPVTPDIFTDLPFIVEGHLYASEEQMSAQIRYVDGQYLVAMIDLRDLPADTYKSVTYYSKLKGYQQYIMIEAWEPVEDPFLKDIETLRPAWSAFAGFVN